ncbi:MAG: four helix bundle protein [Muribaculaceae bacterium]|nr:four helix bundle protein [Muribaculaceae bacterium]
MAEFQFQFEKLDTWKESRKLVVQVYKLLEKFPKTEQYALCDQLRRAAISIPSNIAEGSGRMAIKDIVAVGKMHGGEDGHVGNIEHDLRLVVVGDRNGNVGHLRRKHQCVQPGI